MNIPEQRSALFSYTALADFSKLINSSLDTEIIAGNLLLNCFGKLMISRGLVLLKSKDNKCCIANYKGLKDFNKTETEKLIFSESGAEILFSLKGYNLNYCYDLITNSGKIGYLLLGAKLSGESINVDDEKFLSALGNIAATAFENARSFKMLKEVNKELDSKINQLSALFELGKEFSGVLDLKAINKLVVYSVIGQMLVTKYAVVLFEKKGLRIVDSKFNKTVLLESLEECPGDLLNTSLGYSDLKNNIRPLFDLGVELIVPMMLKGNLRGLIILGAKISKAVYSSEDIEFISAVGGLAAISIENNYLFSEMIEKQKMEKDIELARNIQQNLLPRSHPKLSSFEISAYNKSARQVGGDYYDLVRIEENIVLAAIGDVSGKGVQAALMMANVQAFLKSIAKQKLTLDKASDLINDLVSDNTMEGGFITFFWCLLNDSDLELTYVNMGHNPPILLRDGVLRRLKTGGMILGVMKTLIPYKCETIKLKQGDVILLYSDGITEAMNSDLEEYTEERLENFIKEQAFYSASDIMSNILADVDEHTQGAEQSDDITCMVIKVV